MIGLANNYCENCGFTSQRIGVTSVSFTYFEYDNKAFFCTEDKAKKVQKLFGKFPGKKVHYADQVNLVAREEMRASAVIFAKQFGGRSDSALFAIYYRRNLRNVFKACNRRL